MAIYDYECQVCGPFTAMRPMMQFQDPCACPACGAEALRAFLNAPAIASVNPGGRIAREESRLSATYPPRSSAAHPAGCGCCMRRWQIPSALSSNGDRVFSSSGPLSRSRR